MKLSHTQAVFAMVAAAFMWSIAGVVTRHLEQARSFEVTFWRSFFTVVSLVAMLGLFHGRSAWARFRSSGWPLWASGLCWTVMFTAYMVALTLTSVANVLVTMSIGPLCTALLARAFLGQRVALRTWTAIVVAGLGIAYMFAGQMTEGRLAGTLVALCVPLAGAVNWTVVQRAQAHGKDIDLVPAVLIGAFLSALATLPLALPFQASAHDVGLLAMLGLVQLAIPCTLSVVCARVLKAPEVSLLCMLEVPFGILLVWLGAGEAPGETVLVGGMLVIGALLANELLGWRQRSAQALPAA